MYRYQSAHLRSDQTRATCERVLLRHRGCCLSSQHHNALRLSCSALPLDALQQTWRLVRYRHPDGTHG